MMITLINEGAINQQNFSLKGLWQAMGEPSLKEGKELGLLMTEKEFTEQMNSTLFPKITGALINRTVQEAYQLAYGVGENLVTVLPSNQKDDTIVGMTSADTLVEVPEGMEYEEAAYGEKYHKIRNRKFGKVIYLTEEMVKYDQTAQFIQRARNIGENAKSKKEEIIMDAVLETATTGPYAAWRPAGTSTTLYSDTSNDPYTSGTLDNSITDVLTDDTDINAALTKFATFTDESAQLITVIPKVLLVAMALHNSAKKIVQSSSTTVATFSQGVINPVQGDYMVFPTPFVDNKKGATYWFLGDFKKQFVYTEVFPLQVFQAKPGNEQEWKRDVVFGFKARFMGGCGAITNRYVVMSTGGG
jgi:hypothetical protein